MTRTRHMLGLLLVIGTLVPVGWAWNPSNGDWLPDDPNTLRVMTWNVKDNLRSNNFKSLSLNGWHSLARIVAAMKPDILLLQEAGDRGSGGGGADSVTNLTIACELFMHGGADPFNGGTVEAYVQLFDPNYDLPYIWVSSITDGFNRNVIMSRYPFASVNGDEGSQFPMPDRMRPDLYQRGGDGGIRGFMFGEIDLPDEIYAGDLVVGNAHLKSGGSSSDREDRLRAAQNIAYYIDYLYNGRDGVPDPFFRLRVQRPPNVLDEFTPVVIGGDWNEDELTNGRRGPAAWLTEAEFAGGNDGTDRDMSDSTYDAAVEPFTGNRATLSSSKLDYIAWQDSIATEIRSFIFDASALRNVPNWYPPETTAFNFSRPDLLSSRASDHRPVITDLALPLVALPDLLYGDLDCSGFVDAGDISPFINALIAPEKYAQRFPDCDRFLADINQSGDIDADDISPFVRCILNAGCPPLP